MIKLSKKRWSQTKTGTVKGMWELVKDITGKSKNNDWLTKIYDSDCDINVVLNKVNDKLKAVFHNDSILSSPDPLPEESWYSPVDAYDVYNLLKNCSTKATGSDMIPSYIYSAASLILCDPLCDIINWCLKSCVVPTVWKFATVSPIPKTNPPNLDNLRPISLLPIPSKILERCVLKQLGSALSSLFGANQYAYKSKSSTTCALIALHELLTRLLDYEDTAAVILISWDFSKAFDSICHNILIAKVNECKLPHNFICLICSYLTDRTQAVKYHHNLSQRCTITSGVPQGSVLGPFLFCIYISNLKPINIENYMSKYADDTQTISRIRKDAFDDDIAAVKENIKHIQHWSSAHKLSLNTNKTKAIIFRKSKCHTINIRDIDPDISEVTCIKLLGVEINNELTWDNHIDATVRICSQRMFSLRVLKRLLTTDELMCVYNGIIRSKLAYCCQIFVGTTDKNKRKLQRVQQRFHRLCCGYDCKNNCVPDLDNRRLELSSRLWQQMHSKDHALHGLLPSKSDRTEH